MEKIKGGISVRDGKIDKIYSAGLADPTGAGSSIDLDGMHVIPGSHRCTPAFLHISPAAALWNAGTWTSKADALGSHRGCMPGKAARTSGWVFFSGIDHTRWKPPTEPGLKEIDSAAHRIAWCLSWITPFIGAWHLPQAFMTLRRSAGTALRCPIDIDINRRRHTQGDHLGRCTR